MNLILGDRVLYKVSNRENGITYAFVAGFNGEKVSLNLFSLGAMTFVNNIVVAESEETATIGQCWVPKRPADK